MSYGETLRRQIASELREQVPTGSRNERDIAVVGMACRFPGAADLDAYWTLLSHGIDAVSEIPPVRWDWREYYDEAPEAPDKMYNKWGGFIEDIEQFDPLFFKISPKEAELMDPQHRLFLEIAWRTLEHAGYAGGALSGTETGVFVGCTNTHYSKRYDLVKESDDYYLSAMGNWNAALASRVSYFLDLHGPAMLVDTLCSSTLSALHTACNSLRRGECTAALVGGVNLVLTPEHFITGSKLRAHSPDGRCKPFDQRANGFTSGEGVGCILLKPLSDALEARDTIYGLVKGTAVNHDGRTNGIMAPNPRSQARVISSALSDAKVSADSISYVECHGTGTTLGDPIEIEGLTQAYRRQTDSRQYCAVGSVKSNFGHLEAAAGIAGIIKVLLSLQHRQLPASLHFETPNPHIPFDTSPFFVNSEHRDWISEGPRRAGISSFGLSGVNAHAILEQAPPENRVSRPVRQCYLLPVSARSSLSLSRLLLGFKEHLEERSDISLTDLCWTASTASAHLKYRLAIVSTSRRELLKQLHQLVSVSDPTRATVAGVHYGEVGDVDAIGNKFTGSDTDTRALTEQHLHELAELHVHGEQVDWKAVYSTDFPGRVPLPPYPFEYQRCWPEHLCDDYKHKSADVVSLGVISEHPLLGRRLTAAV